MEETILCDSLKYFHNKAWGNHMPAELCLALYMALRAILCHRQHIYLISLSTNIQNLGNIFVDISLICFINVSSSYSNHVSWWGWCPGVLLAQGIWSINIHYYSMPISSQCTLSSLALFLQLMFLNFESIHLNRSNNKRLNELINAFCPYASALLPLFLK